MTDKRVVVRYRKKCIVNDPALIEKIWEDPQMLKYSESELIDMITECNKYISDTVTSTRDGVQMPHYMGIMVAGTWGNREKKNVVLSKKLGKDVFYPNHHSDGYGGMIYYMTYETSKKFAVGKFWAFEPCNRMRDQLKKGYEKNWKMYVHVPNNYSIHKLFLKNKSREYGRKISQDMLECYDEFEI